MYPENNRKHGLYFDPNEYLEGRDNDGNVIGKQSPALGFYHEATHRLRNLRRPMRVAIRSIFHSSNWSDLEEKRVVQKYESGIARILLEFIRTTDYR